MVARDETLPEALARIRETKKLPAIGFAAWRDGKELVVLAIGDRKPGSAVTVDDPWHLGSNTKAMTALLVGIYVDRGVVKWDDTIGALFKGEKLHPDYAKITLDQLLRHTSGAPANPSSDVFERGDPSPDARHAIVRDVLAQKPAHEAGTFEYSNTGYIIVGAALERVTKKSWETLMRTEIFEPLGMTSCGFGAPTGDAPWGHDDNGTPIEPGPKADNPPSLGPAGTVHCSLRDYGKYLAVHAGSSPKQLITTETLERLHRATDGESYAGGWMVIGPVLVHSGSNTLWFATALVGREKHSALVIVSNKGESLENDLFSLVPLVAKTYPP